MHEENHPDFKCADQDVKAQHSEGAIPIGKFDLDSVMSYCFLYSQLKQGTLPKTGQLSAGDIEAIDLFYSDKVVTAKSKECTRDGGRWSTMNLAFGCCFDLPEGAHEGSSYQFCGSEEYLKSQSVEKVHEALANICAKEKLGYDKITFACVGA